MFGIFFGFGLMVFGTRIGRIEGIFADFKVDALLWIVISSADVNYSNT
jgi:hypothetical protein